MGGIHHQLGLRSSNFRLVVHYLKYVFSFNLEYLSSLEAYNDKQT